MPPPKPCPSHHHFIPSRSIKVALTLPLMVVLTPAGHLSTAHSPQHHLQGHFLSHQRMYARGCGVGKEVLKLTSNQYTRRRTKTATSPNLSLITNILGMGQYQPQTSRNWYWLELLAVAWSSKRGDGI